MKKLFFLMMLFFISICYSQDLKIIFGNRIYYHYDGELIKVKQVNNCTSINGYDIIDSVNIFLAYDPEDPEGPSTNVSIYNVNYRKEIIIGTLYDTGTSNFSYNIENDYVVYNLFDGIYMFKLHDKDGQLNYSINGITEKVLSCDTCKLIFWIDKNTIGYYSWEYNKNVLKTLKIKKKDK